MLLVHSEFFRDILHSVWLILSVQLPVAVINTSLLIHLMLQKIIAATVLCNFRKTLIISHVQNKCHGLVQPVLIEAQSQI